MKQSYHAPVLAEQVVSLLCTDPGGIYLDGTIGGGGHAEAICRTLSGQGRLIGFDLDENALRAAGARLAWSDRVTIVRANFSRMSSELNRLGISSLQGVLLDLGVSSFQLDAGELGFSYRKDARIDMRMDREQALSGWDVVNTYGERELGNIIREFGEERFAGRIARRIVSSRPVNTTIELRDVVGSAVGGRFLTKSLSRVFQAIRIEVNRELAHLEEALHGAVALLSPGGRILVIAYHSLEDRMVKGFFRKNTDFLTIITKKPIRAGEEEIGQNPRARSAKLRGAERRAETGG